MDIINTTWPVLKEFATTRGLSIQYIDHDGNYYLRVFDDVFALGMILPKQDSPSADQTDFETNFKPSGNKKLDLSKDSENAPIQRMKMAPAGWTYKLRGIEFKTSKNGLDSYDINHVARTDVVLRHFDENGAELSDEGQPADYVHPECVETWMEWEPPHDFEIIGGTIRVLNQVTDDCRLWVIAVPDIPYEFGGSRIMVDHINFKYLQPGDRVEADGRVSKRLTYHPIMHTNKMRFVFKHAQGAQHDFLVMLEFFKP